MCSVPPLRAVQIVDLNVYALVWAAQSLRIVFATLALSLPLSLIPVRIRIRIRTPFGRLFIKLFGQNRKRC